MKKRLLALALSLVLALGGIAPAHAAPAAPTVERALSETAAALQTRTPGFGSIGGEWLVFGLSRSAFPLSDRACAAYYDEVCATLRACGGVLSATKNTEYSRLILALGALGLDPQSVAGYDLLAPLADFQQTLKQGVGGAIWAFLALEALQLEPPKGALSAKPQGSRAAYLQAILDAQLSDGGWSLTKRADVDLTAMALTALAARKEEPLAAEAIARGLDCLESLQNADGSFGAGVESTAQALVALSALGNEQPRFTKNGRTPTAALLSFYRSGAFLREGKANQMATEQGFYALVAAQRAAEGAQPLFALSDALRATVPPVRFPGKTFSDIASSPARAAIEALAARGIVSGKSPLLFAPEDPLTRGEFALLLLRALGLPERGRVHFSDVPAQSFCADAVECAAAYGIIRGTAPGEFSPDGSLTKKQTALLLTRAQRFTGGSVSPSVSRRPITRAEAAQALYTLLAPALL